MIWQPVTSVGSILPCKSAVREFTYVSRWGYEAGSVTVPITSPKLKPNLPPQSDYRPSEAMGLRAAMIRDRQAAMQRRDMRAVHEIESDLREVTRAILGKGA